MFMVDLTCLSEYKELQPFIVIFGNLFKAVNFADTLCEPDPQLLFPCFSLACPSSHYGYHCDGRTRYGPQYSNSVIICFSKLNSKSNLFHSLSNTLLRIADRVKDRTDRSGRRRPFSTWMKKLTTNFKGSSTDAHHPANSASKRNTYQMKSHSKKRSNSKNNNPYPESGHLNGDSTAPENGHPSYSTMPSGNTRSTSSLQHRRNSVQSSENAGNPPTIGNKSTAATMSIDVAHSEVAPSNADSSGGGTTATVGGGISSTREANSTFSTPAASVRSLTTTLTTIQSAAPPTTQNSHNTAATNNTQVQFTHQFPTSPPPTALPAHLAPQGSGGHPATYSTATANNLLTDNASILTLASSSKRRRRRSMDTDASVRALAPSSLFGGSRESLPLSILSANMESSASATTPGLHQPRVSLGGPNERASIYSATGVAPALPSERNSYYAGKQSGVGDGGSVKSGLLGHGRNDSISGSIGGMAPPGSPLAGPRETGGRLSRTNSAWGDTIESPSGDIEKVETEDKDKDEKA
ncbi:hypothetical protein B7494_g5174 [Chlorociboria aeruginascens]|nr:hypothetical protein B7494_g5174 [Chlorociboria aeruginascens]